MRKFVVSELYDKYTYEESNLGRQIGVHDSAALKDSAALIRFIII